METTTSNLIKPFFIGEYPFTSLNSFKELIKNFPNENQKKKEKSINKLLGFVKFSNFIPLHLNSNNKISIDTFNCILNLRGLINKNDVNNKEAFIFISSSDKNLHDQKFNVDPCKILMKDNKLNEIQYSQYLQKDIHAEFISTCDAKKLFPLPIVIYDHFINHPNFSFVSYCEDEKDPKILFNHSIFWTMKFFLYGLINDCKIIGKSSDPVNNIIYFIERGMEIKDPYFPVLIQESKEFNHYLYDHLFTQFCIQEANKEFISKFYFYNYMHKDPIFQDICAKYPKIYENLKIANPWPFDLNAFHLNDDEISPISLRALFSFKKIFIEIPELEKAIQKYDEWKKKNIEMLANENIFELIRKKLFQRNRNVENFDDQFGQWLFNSDISLINREVYSTFKAIQKGEKETVNMQIQILKGILNPWNKDDRIFNYFIYHFLNSNANFTSYVKFNEKVINGFSILIDIYRNCKPFYFGEKKDGDEILTYILYEKCEVKTFYIERLLYCNTMFPTVGKSVLKKIFNFFCNLQFANKTTDLCFLAAFANEIVSLFRDQLNLSFIFLTTADNCIDLLDEKRYPLIQKVIDQFKNWECFDQLKEALKSADLYNKGQNASEKLKSYINKLIEINNNTILDRKNHPDKIHFRLFCMSNTHSNMSLMNTFVPALSHLNSNTLDPKKLISAYYLLTKKNNQSKNGNKISIDTKTTLNSSLPTVFDYRPELTKSFSKTIMVHILPIQMNENFLGFDVNKVALSLCLELHNHIKDNPDSYRTLIFNKINSYHSVSSDFDDGDEEKEKLNTLMALFEVFNKNEKENHQFFSTENWKNKIMPPEIINGAKAAYAFLNNFNVMIDE